MKLLKAALWGMQVLMSGVNVTECTVVLAVTVVTEYGVTPATIP